MLQLLTGPRRSGGADREPDIGNTSDRSLQTVFLLEGSAVAAASRPAPPPAAAAAAATAAVEDGSGLGEEWDHEICWTGTEIRTGIESVYTPNSGPAIHSSIQSYSSGNWDWDWD